MAKQIQQAGGVLGKVAQRMKTAHEQHKNDDTEYSKFGELPDGIEGGIARLVEAKFDFYKEGDNKGEPYFYGAGVVVTPVEFIDKKGQTWHIEGLRTTLGPIPICDTKAKQSGNVTTLDEHVARLYNELRKLGIETAKLQFEHLEATVAKLKEIGPHFKFRTWKGKATEQYPDPRTNHDWQGIIKFTPNATNAVKDNTGNGAPAARPTTQAAAPKASPPAQRPTTPARPTAPQRPAKAPVQPKPQPEPDGQGFDEFGDLASLVERASADDGAAQEELTRLAGEAGVGDDAANAQTWQEVADLIEQAQVGQGNTDQGGADGEGEWVPAVTEVYAYRPMDSKTKAPSANQILAQVMEVDEANRLVKLCNTKNKKQTFANVSWDALESAS